MKIDLLLLLLMNSLHSLWRVFSGVSLALVIGVIFGILRSNLPLKIKKNPVVNFIFEAPKFPPPIAWIPFVIIFIGVGDFPAIVIVFIGAFSPIFTSAFDAAESLPEILKNTADTFELRRFQYILKIILPYSLPRIFTGLRSAVSMGWMAVIAAEMVSGQSGLGYSIQLNRLNLDYSSMVVDMTMIAIIGYVLFYAVNLLEKRIIKWKPI